MQRSKRFLDDFDQLISDTLHDQMGPPPDRAIWDAVRREISASATGQADASSRTSAHSPLTWVQRMLRIGFQTPLARGALTMAIFGFVILSQPELESLWHPVMTPVPLPATGQITLSIVEPLSAANREAAFERLVEMDDYLLTLPSQSRPTIEFHPVPDPAQLRVKVRPNQPVKSLRNNTELPRPVVVRATLSGGMHR